MTDTSATPDAIAEPCDELEPDDNVHFFSPSQIDTFLSCPRKWAWRYLAGKKGPSHKSAVLGTRVHALLEHYLKTGEDLPVYDPDPEIREAADIALSGIHLLPKPKTPGMVIESGDDGFAFETVGEPGHPSLYFRGYKDIEINADGAESGEVEVWDHKTTSNFAYAKTPEDLKEDVQAIIYAYEAMATHKTKVVNLNWVYYATRGPRKAKRVHLRLTSDHVAPRFLAMRPVLELLDLTLREGKPAWTFPADLSQCDAYGGCPYREDCAPYITPNEKVKAAMALSPSAQAMMDRLAQRKGQLEGEPAPAADAKPNAAQAMLAALKAKKAAELPAEAPAVQAPAVAINPPNEFQPESAADEPEKPVVEAKPVKAPGRGRPTGSKNKPKEEQAPLVAPVQESIAPTPPDMAGSVQESPGGELIRGFNLFVDCTPMGIKVIFAEQIFKSVQANLLEKHGKSDYRFFEFGQGPGRFQEELQAIVDAGDFEGDTIVVDSSTPQGALSLAVFMPAAVCVVRGFR